jgi:hypothetical protein
MPTGGREPPASEGAYSGAIAADSAGDVERVVPEGVETTTVMVQATQPGGNSGTVAIGFGEGVDQTSGVLMSDGQTISIDINADAQGLYVHFDTAGDQVRVLAVD